MQLTQSSEALPVSSLLPEEIRVIEIKYSAQPISKLAPEELKIQSDILLLKIYAITGWKMPPDALVKMLLDQLYKKLSESYGNCNMNEIEYAFRHFTVNKEYGESLSIKVIEAVMSQYLSRRYELSEIERRSQAGNQITLPNLDWREMIQMAFEAFQDKMTEMRLWPVEFYTTLVVDGFIPAGLHDQFDFIAKNYLIKSLEKKLGYLMLQEQSGQVSETSQIGHFKSSKAMQDEIREYREGKRRPEILLLAKQMAVRSYFVTLKERNVSRIYQQEKS